MTVDGELVALPTPGTWRASWVGEIVREPERSESLRCVGDLSPLAGALTSDTLMSQWAATMFSAVRVSMPGGMVVVPRQLNCWDEKPASNGP